MALKSDAHHWGSMAKWFHWLIVAGILIQAAIGLIMVELPKRPNIQPVYDLHKSIGLTILALAILRVLWRLFDGRPENPPGMGALEILVARAGHGLLYVLLFALPISGWLLDSASGLRALRWWGVVPMPRLVDADRELKALALTAHNWLFWLLALVALGHAAAALKHHYIDRDTVLSRMLPGRRKVS